MILKSDQEVCSIYWCHNECALRDAEQSFPRGLHTCNQHHKLRMQVFYTGDKDPVAGAIPAASCHLN